LINLLSKHSAAAASVLTCATCPVCFGVYSAVFPLLGLGVPVDHRVHAALVLLSVILAIGSVLRSRKKKAQTRIALPAILVGAALLLSSELFGEVPWLEYPGFALVAFVPLLSLRKKPDEGEGVARTRSCPDC
jgi:hypothetical protein